MEQNIKKPIRSFLKNMLVRLFLLSVLLLCLRYRYVMTTTVTQEFNAVKLNVVNQLTATQTFLPTAPAKPTKLSDIWATPGFEKGSRFYSSVFEDLMHEGFLRLDSKAVCLETSTGVDVFALKEIGVRDAVGIFKKSWKPLVVSQKESFDDGVFDFVFSGGGMIEKSKRPVDFALEIGRMLKPEGYLVVHVGVRDRYSLDSLIGLFNCCKLEKSRDIENGLDDAKIPVIREIIMGKEFIGDWVENFDGDCSVSSHKRELIHKAEALIMEEPKKPWITLKKNIKNVKYLSSMADISFKQRDVYVDVVSRSYGSSIVSWFKKQYQKQNQTFDIYAIEADKHFHEEYKYKKGVNLLPYAAWVKNESLFFEINHTPGDKDVVKGRGMGRIQPADQMGGSSASHVDETMGFDFAEWLKSTVTDKDFVVMKMDVEGAEFHLIPRLFETGAICLIDEIFLECHYNRWQKCCPGERSPKYEKTYDQCMELFTSLRDSGVLLHLWW